MTPQQLLDCIDTGLPWSAARPGAAAADLATAYQAALAVRALRIARGERPRGYKIGFTNRTIWARYEVYAPIWGTVWDTTLEFCEGAGELVLEHTCQPRIEPEVVFGFKFAPRADAGLQDLYDAIDWMAPGFEIVQSHAPGWKFSGAETVADSGLHARLLVGPRVPLPSLAADAQQLHALLATARVELCHGPNVVEQGEGANVLDSPLQALRHFVSELRACPGATDLQGGDVVTTGTWTDAWPVQAGQIWSSRFTAPLAGLSVSLR